MPRIPRRQLLLHGALAAALYTVVGLVYLRPIWQVYPDHIAPSAGDPVFTLYVLKWVIHQAHLGFPDLWNANVFYPAKGALAFSDPFLGPALAISFVPNPIAGYNLLFFSSFVLAGLATWGVLAASGVSPVAALLGGAMYAFSPFRFSQMDHLSILLGQWIPLTLWSFDRLLALRTGRRAALFLLFYALNLTSGCYFAYMILFPLLAILGSRALELRRELVRPAALRVLAPAALLAGLATLALFLPYLRLSQRMDMARDEREIATYGAALASYLSPAPDNLYSPHSPRNVWDRSHLPRWQQPFVRSENSLFPGFLPTLLALLGFALFWRRYRRERVRPERPVAGWRRLVLGTLLALALLAYALGDAFTLKLDRDILSAWLPAPGRPLWIGLGATLAGCLALGAFLHRRWSGGGVLAWRAMDPWERGLALSGGLTFLLSHPIVFVPLMGVVPGMNGMRVPARFAAFFFVTVVYFAARGLDAALARIGRPAGRGLAAAALVLVLLVELMPRPVRWIEVLREEDFPDVYAWLASRDEVRALVEIPLRPNWRGAAYMYYSTRHWKPIANGYSSFLPPSFARLADALQNNLPDGEALDLLERMGVTHLVVHPLDLGGAWRRVKDPGELLKPWEEELRGRIELVRDFDPDRVYRIVPRPPAPLPIGITGLRVGERRAPAADRRAGGGRSRSRPGRP